jgi:polysaccharide biosynthesis/export protein
LSVFLKKRATSPFFYIIVSLLEKNMNIKSIFAVFLGGLLSSAMVYAADADYRLNSGDALQVSVWGEESLQKEVTVLPDGSISFPLAGRVVVANATSPEVEKLITEKLKTYLPDPQVTVVVSNIQGNRAYILGKVLKPGPILLSAPTNVLQALSQAGGLDRFADLDDIKIVRADTKGQTVISVHYDKLIKGQQLESNILLKNGDTILVP